MRITDATFTTDRMYVKVEADVGVGEIQKAIFYIRTRVWVNMTGEQMHSELQMMQHADLVIDPKTKLVIKDRFPHLDDLPGGSDIEKYI